MSKKILIIAEGEHAERNFFDSLKDAFELDYTFCCLRGNIYLLYNKMKEIDFNADIKSILLELHPEYREQLNDKFAFTYLVFDFDPHHTKRIDNRTIDAVISDNCISLQEMVGYFVDETDPSIGKLYVNYPMMESYRTCDSTFDEGYKDESVILEDIKSFKSYAGTKKLVRRHLKDYSQRDFKQLVKQNVFKLNWIDSQVWDKMPYKRYLNSSSQENVLAKQIRLISDNRCVSVLNTSLFMILDYYGNRDGFYDTVFDCD